MGVEIGLGRNARKSVLVCGLFAAVALAFGQGCPVKAQTTPNIPTVISPLTVEPDHNGVNIATGKLTFEPPQLRIPAAPHLQFDFIQNSTPYLVDQASGTGDSVRKDSVSIHYGGSSSESFTCSDYDCTPAIGSGATLSLLAGIYTQAPSGVVYVFDKLQVDSKGNGTEFVQKYASYVYYPDGEVIRYTYQNGYLPNDTFHRTFYRPIQVSSNAGYSITITYQTDSTDITQTGWGSPKQATLYSNADPTVPIQQLSYSGNNTIIDIAGRTYKCSSCVGSLGSAIETASGDQTLPGETSAYKSVMPNASQFVVASATEDGVQWNYSYQNLGYDVYSSRPSFSNVTVTGPNSYQQSYAIISRGTGGFSHIYLVNQITDSLGRVMVFGYDNANHLTSITSPLLNSVAIGYDGLGNISGKTTFAVPSTGLPAISESAKFPATLADIGGNTSCIPRSDANEVRCFRPIWHIDGLGRETDYAYNVSGQLAEQIDPADTGGVHKVTFIEYTSSGISRESVVHVCGLASPPAPNPSGVSTAPTNPCPLSSEFHTEYDYWGNTQLPSVERRTDEATGVTLTTTYGYDNAGRLLSVVGPLAGKDRYYRYDVLGRKTWDIGPANASGVRPAKRYTYRDSDDKVIAVETGTVPDPNNVTLTVASRVDMSYDSRRNPIQDATSSSGTIYEVVNRSFDDRGQKTCETTRMNAAVFASLPADACALGTQGTYGPDRITHNVYDAAGQLLKVQKAYNVPTLQQDYATYTYSLNGKQASVTDADHNLAMLTYDGYDRLQQWTFPSKTTVGQVNSADYEFYQYDAVGNRTSVRRRDGRTLTFNYDNLNRVISKLVPAGCAPIQVGACPPATATRNVYYGYDVRGLQLYARFDSATGDGVTNAYDGFGRLTSSTLAMGGTSRTLGHQYDADGNRTRITHPDGNAFTQNYDALDHLIQTFGPTGDQLDLMAYDGLGRRVSRYGGSQRYGYDGIDRLTSDTIAFGHSFDVATTLGYNPAGQIVSHTRSNDGYVWTGGKSVTRNYAVNGLNQYTNAGPATYTYDANGNLISDTVTTYVYDAENRLVSASGGANVAIAYDPLGRLWRTSSAGYGTTQFLYDGDALVAEYDEGSGAMLHRYVHGQGADEPIIGYQGAGVGPTAPQFITADHQGSIVLVFDRNINAVTINSYDEYGIPGPFNGGRFQYTGQAWIPDLGMYYYKARIYSPQLGRFLQVDPVGYKDQINLYAYVANDPVDGRDPSGNETASVTCMYDACGANGSISRAQAVTALDRLADVTDALGTAAMMVPSPAGEGIGSDLESAAAGMRETASVMRAAGSAERTTSQATKAFSSEKAAMVAMAKADKVAGISKTDMKAYKDLNKGLKDPFPANKVRGPEAHPGAKAASSRSSHGHVGPVDHIPINKSDRICTGTRICP